MWVDEYDHSGQGDEMRRNTLRLLRILLYGDVVLLTPITLTGPAFFADDSQLLTTNITDASGSYALQLKPTEGATPGDTFTLGGTLAGLRLERVGAIAWEVYLPLIRRGRS